MRYESAALFVFPTVLASLPAQLPGVSRGQGAKSKPLHGATRERELLSCSGRNTIVAGAFLLVACRRNVLPERTRAAGINRSAATASGAAGRPCDQEGRFVRPCLCTYANNSSRLATWSLS